MEVKKIRVNEAAVNHGSLSIRECGSDFFPDDTFGASSKKGGIGQPIIIEAQGLDSPIYTDIPKDKTSGKPRWIFRERKWVKNFIKAHNLSVGSFLSIRRIGNRNYEIKPVAELSIAKVNHNVTVIQREDAHQQMPKKQIKKLDIGVDRICDCTGNRINCLTAKEWLKSQLGVWQFSYSKRDIRDKNLHPATFPISLASKVIELFSHKGELVLDPFVGSGTTLVAAQDLGRNAVGFDLKKEYVKLAEDRLKSNNQLFTNCKQLVVGDDARNISEYFDKDSIKCIFTSPPYANLLNRKRQNKSRRNRKNEQLGKIEQYSQDVNDLGTMPLESYTEVMGDIFERLLPLLKPKGHCVINVPDMWWENQRITIHVSLIQELRKRGYELRNIIIWDRTNLVNQIGIFGWPSNYITMGVTFEYLLDFWRPPIK